MSRNHQLTLYNSPKTTIYENTNSKVLCNAKFYAILCYPYQIYLDSFNRPQMSSQIIGHPAVGSDNCKLLAEFQSGTLRIVYIYTQHFNKHLNKQRKNGQRKIMH